MWRIGDITEMRLTHVGLAFNERASWLKQNSTSTSLRQSDALLVPGARSQ